MRVLLVLLYGLALLCGRAAAAPTDPLPAALEPWREWVLKQYPDARCPRLQGLEQRLCYWPGRFEFVVDGERARFAGSATLYAESILPLPGSLQHWPERVLVDGKAVAVIQNGQQPQVRLPAGSYRIEGEIGFERRPEELPLPEGYALTALQLDGRAVEQPRRTPGGLWLGRPENAGTAQADSLQVEVYRLLADGQPPRLSTRLRLNVAGRAREQQLVAVLPPGFALVHVDSPLNARIEGNDLVLQLRPGSFEIDLEARALEPLASVVLQPAAEPWPAEEIWSYAPDARLRETSASGPTPIDPAQAGVPDEWHAYASFLLDGSQPLQIEPRNRGLDPAEPNRLHLNRRLWLSFDAARWLAKDNINGQMRSGWRLDARPPFALTRAAVDGEPVLVTRMGESTGVEVRSPAPNLEASAEAPWTTRLPATGWASDFESAQLALELPPGWRLLHVGGADRSSDTWLQRFGLFEVGLLMALALLAWRFGGVRLAALAVLVGLLGHGESGAPGSAVAVLLLFGLLALLLPQGRLRRIGTVLSGLLLLLVGLACLHFVERQLLLALHPQLERSDLSGYRPAQQTALQGLLGGLAAVGDLAGGGRYASVPAAAAPPPPPPPPAPAPQAAMEAMDELQVTGRRIQANSVDSASPVMQVQSEENFAARRKQRIERYSAGTNVQAGRAEPDWHWNSHTIGFDGRVTAATELRPWLSPPWLTTLWRLLAAFATLALFWQFLRRLLQAGSLPSGQRWLWTATALLCLSGPALAQQELPDSEWLQRLEQRLLQEPPCRQQGCASLARASIDASGTELVVQLEAHAEAAAAIALPLLAERSWTSANLDQQPAALLQHYGQPWIALAPGVHRIELRARLDRAQQARLRFPQAVLRIGCRSDGWLCSGIDQGRLLSDTLELTPEAAGGEALDASTPATRSSVAPFVRVERDFAFELDWQITTSVHRVAPLEGGITVQVPLQPGEQLLTEGLEVKDGTVAISLQPGANSYTFITQIDPVAGIELEAQPWQRYSEVWRLRPGPAWHLRYSGVPAVAPLGEAEWVHWFFPLPGEKLRLELDRPEAASGTTLAIDNVRLLTRGGTRQQDTTLALTLRATQGGQHTIRIPADAELTALRMDGSLLNAKPRDGVLAIPIRPGSQQLQVEFRDQQEPGWHQHTPDIDLRAATSNLTLTLQPPPKRWLLWLDGPGVGPVLLAWSYLLGLLLLVAWLRRQGWLPLPLPAALLLALGCALVGWPLLPLLLLLVGAIGWRSRDGGALRPWAFRIGQAGLAAYAIGVLLLTLLAVVQRLNHGPDMAVTGLNSGSSSLNWFADLGSGPLPVASAWSLPLQVYQGLLLAWTVWLALRLLGWLRSGWQALNRDGLWTPARWRELQAARAEAAAAAVAAGPAAAVDPPAAGG